MYDTLGTGVSSVVVRLGASQASNVPFYIMNNAGTASLSGFNASGALFTTVQQGHNYYNLASDPVRWITFLANTETGSNVGSDFFLARYNDAGVFQDYPFWVKRSTGVATFSQTIAGSVTGNAATATVTTALAADPANCTAGSLAAGVNASGTAEGCVAATNLNTASTIVQRDASGNFTAGTVTAALTGNAGTASALAANPTDCSANQYANTIAANGNLTCAQVAKTQLSDYYAPQRTKVYLTGNQSINDSSVTAIAWNGEEYDTNALHDNSTNPSRITIPAGQGGTYVLACQLSYAANATGQRFVVIADKNATNIAVASATNAGASYSSRFTAYTEVVAAAADWFTCSAFQDSTGALNVLATAAESFFLARRVD